MVRLIGLLSGLIRQSLCTKYVRCLIREAEEATKRAEEVNERLRAEKERKLAELQAEHERRTIERNAMQRGA